MLLQGPNVLPSIDLYSTQLPVGQHTVVRSTVLLLIGDNEVGFELAPRVATRTRFPRASRNRDPLTGVPGELAIRDTKGLPELVARPYVNELYMEYLTQWALMITVLTKYHQRLDDYGVIAVDRI
jgi:hypothetical protein